MLRLALSSVLTAAGNYLQPYPAPSSGMFLLTRSQMRPLLGADVCVQCTPGTKSVLALFRVVSPRGKGPTLSPCQTTMPGVLLNKRRGSSAENCVPRLPRVQVESLDSPSSSLHFSLICPTTDQLPGKLGHPFIFSMISFQHFYWTVLQVCKWKSTEPVVFLRGLR